MSRFANWMYMLYFSITNGNVNNMVIGDHVIDSVDYIADRSNHYWKVAWTQGR